MRRNFLGAWGLSPLLVVGVVALLGGLMAVLSSPVPAQASQPIDDQALQVERQLGCPICTNLPLDVCDNQICNQMKGVIRDKLKSGDTPQQVVEYFVARYGDGVLLTPPQRGFNLLGWYVPILGVIVGIGIVWLFVRRSLNRNRVLERELDAAAAIDDVALEAYRRRVRSELDGTSSEATGSTLSKKNGHQRKEAAR